VTDDHPIVQEGLVRALQKRPDFDVLAAATTVKETRQLVTDLHPDVLILDLRLPGGGALGLIAELATLVPPCHVIVYSALAEPTLIDRARKQGVRGFISKGSSLDQLMAGIRAVHRGEFFFPDPDGEPGDAYVFSPPEQIQLSERELAVLRRLARGYTNRQVAEQLRVSVKSVETYRARLCEKLGALDRADLVQRAAELGLLEGAHGFG
jgi:DNA-binding NarL/FixJ family response regulator